MEEHVRVDYSIIIPAYNEEEYLPKTLASLREAMNALNMWLFLSRIFKWACGAYIFCTREAFMETGGFDERYYASEEIHFSRALCRWGQKKGKSFVILKEPIISSSRKMVWYSVWEILMMAFGLLLHFKPLRNRDACYKMWYRHPKKKS